MERVASIGVQMPRCSANVLDVSLPPFSDTQAYKVCEGVHGRFSTFGALANEFQRISLPTWQVESTRVAANGLSFAFKAKLTGLGNLASASSTPFVYPVATPPARLAHSSLETSMWPRSLDYIFSRRGTSTRWLVDVCLCQRQCQCVFMFASVFVCSHDFLTPCSKT